MARGDSCLKCQGKMQAGYVLDKNYVAVFVSAWREGTPEKGLLGGIKENKMPHPITTFRCTECGFLESYADAPS
jgi:hypothetical protein